MPATIWFRHQNTDVLPDRFIRTITKKSFGGGTKGSYNPVLADDDHRIRYGVENRLEMMLVQAQFMFRALTLVDVENNAVIPFVPILWSEKTEPLPAAIVAGRRRGQREPRRRECPLP